MKYAVLGGGGCFGLNLARMLIQRGHEVIGLGRSPLKGEAFTLGTERMGYRYRTYSLGPDNEFVMQWLDEERPHVIVNYAAQGEGAASFKALHWKYFYRTNVDALVDLSERLLERNYIECFIQVGTSEVYGGVDHAVPEGAPVKPSSPYAVSKLTFDLHLQSIAKVWQFPAIIVRPSNCTTPGQQMHRVVPKAFAFGCTGRKLELHGGGVARKSYMAADDLSEAIMLLVEKGKIGEVYNCGPQDPVSIRHLVAMCSRILGLKFDELVNDVADRTGQDSCYWIDSAKLRALGWAPRKSLIDTLTEVHEWVRRYLDTLARIPTDYEMRA